jgi:hypothetical protein
VSTRSRLQFSLANALLGMGLIGFTVALSQDLPSFAVFVVCAVAITLDAVVVAVFIAKRCAASLRCQAAENSSHLSFMRPVGALAVWGSIVAATGIGIRSLCYTEQIWATVGESDYMVRSDLGLLIIYRGPRGYFTWLQYLDERDYAGERSGLTVASYDHGPRYAELEWWFGARRVPTGVGMLHEVSVPIWILVAARFLCRTVTFPTRKGVRSIYWRKGAR